jgi:serine carboxypeptidase-like clade 1
VDNPYSWNKAAHMIYLDSPAGVGMVREGAGSLPRLLQLTPAQSYSDDKTDYITNDSKTAIDADAFLRVFFERYPEFSGNEFFIAGESYAGIYVPNLALLIAQNNDAGVKPAINIKGYAVGNGCTDDQFDGNALVPYVVGKSLISADAAAAVHVACQGSYWNATPGSDCNTQLNAIDRTLAGLNIYGTLEDCVSRAGDQSPAALAALPLPTVGRAWPLRATLPKPGQLVQNWKMLGVNVPCMDLSAAETFFDRDDVRAAIHALPMEYIGHFDICTNQISYTHDAGSMIPKHKALLQRGIRALVYSGDHDMCVPHTGSEAWTHSLGMPVADAWRSWTIEKADGVQVAGYTRSYTGGLTYATVKGAGHTVPEYKPAEALQLFQRFLAAAPL